MYSSTSWRQAQLKSCVATHRGASSHSALPANLSTVDMDRFENQMMSVGSEVDKRGGVERCDKPLLFAETTVSARVFRWRPPHQIR